MVLARTTDRVGAAIDLLQLYGHQPAARVRAPEDDAIEGIVGSVSEKGLLDRAYRNPSIVERTVGEVMDRPLPTIGVETTLDDAFAHPVRRRRRAARACAGSGRRASSPSSTCSSTSRIAATATAADRRIRRLCRAVPV